MDRPTSDLESLRVDLHHVYDGDPWHGSSISKVLRGLLQHHTYHQGQIAILRRAAETRG